MVYPRVTTQPGLFPKSVCPYLRVNKERPAKNQRQPLLSSKHLESSRKHYLRSFCLIGLPDESQRCEIKVPLRCVEIILPVVYLSTLDDKIGIGHPVRVVSTYFSFSTYADYDLCSLSTLVVAARRRAARVSA